MYTVYLFISLYKYIVYYTRDTIDTPHIHACACGVRVDVYLEVVPEAEPVTVPYGVSTGRSLRGPQSHGITDYYGIGYGSLGVARES
jgi:hypothetical protein